MISGVSITQVRDDIYLVDVVVRATQDQRVSIDTLRNTAIPLPGGRTVPLSQFATFEYAQEYPLVWRRDRLPTLTVHADLRPGILPDTVVSAAERMANLMSKITVSSGASHADYGVCIARKRSRSLPGCPNAACGARRIRRD